MATVDWRVRTGDILEEVADALVCSANPFLTLSGGVGGALLVRYGTSLQTELQEYLASQRVAHVPRGTVVVTRAVGTPYRAVLHAVAVNGFYESSPAVVGDVVRAALREAAKCEARTVALAALATGYGKLTMRQFAEGLVPVVTEAFPSIQTVTIVVRGAGEAKQITEAVPAVHLS